MAQKERTDDGDYFYSSPDRNQGREGRRKKSEEGFVTFSVPWYVTVIVMVVALLLGYFLTRIG